ncbi:MAG TPA: tryptophan synthase subunit alpha [Flavitalea sp.]|nr:tryptophan synthase subunit alpha [Flavitalea sp.]
MSRIKELFIRKQQRILNVYCTAGYPARDSTIEVMEGLQAAGVDMIELGMPYSDPLADGPIIQASSAKAIENGMSIPVLLDQLQGFRKKIHVPVVLMGYMNPVVQFGFEKLCKAAAAAGIDGFILPDLPLYEFTKEYKMILQENGLDFIFLITPETSEERIRLIDEQSSGFLYAVSSSSTTGTDKDFSQVEKYLERLNRMQLKNPVLAGFGIRDRITFESACVHASGAIIGTAFVKAIDGKNNLSGAIESFIKPIRN